MIRFVVLMFLTISIVFSFFQFAGASDPGCFKYRQTIDYDSATPAASTAQQGATSTASPRKATLQAAHTSIEAICADGKRAIGKVADISDVVVHDCFTDEITFDTNKYCNGLSTNIIIKSSKALADKLEPYGPGKDRPGRPKIRLQFKITSLITGAIKGELINYEVQQATSTSKMPKQAQPAASSLPPPAGSVSPGRSDVALPPPPSSQPPERESSSLPPPPLPEGAEGQQAAPTASLPAPQQPQAQPAPAQEPQGPATDAIEKTLNIFQKARGLFK